MHVLLPKPLHGWRAFVGEVAIIVLGVLIALGFGQLAQAWNDQSNSREARKAIQAEIAGDLGALSQRALTEDCIARRLDEISAHLDSVVDGEVNSPVTWLGKPQQWDMDTFRWDAASQSGRVSLLPVAEQSNYSDIYGVLKSIGVAELDEQRLWAQLRSLEGQRRISANMVDTLRLVVSQARYSDYQIRLLYGEGLDEARTMGITPVVDPRFPARRSVCIPIRTPRAEGLKILNYRFGAP